MKRFEFINTSLYTSATSLIVSARDLESESGTAQVALKFIKEHSHFQREMNIRSLIGKYGSDQSNDSHRYILTAVQSFDGMDGDEKAQAAFSKEISRCNNIRGCSSFVVMPLAEKSLKHIIMSEQLLEVELKLIKFCCASSAQ